MPERDHPIVLFDGHCNLCSAGVQFIMARDPAGLIRFASTQSEAGRDLLRRHLGSDAPPGSMVLIEGARVSLRSDASLRIAARLTRPWSWLRVFLVLPRALRDPLYRLVAALRYRIAGRRDTCWAPTPEYARRFLG
jgi:predicted DCC family thiol-disulfide oxidoreductase YuxK